ncbi:hypothetical protein Tco_0119398, partial [Tanacetum coccineum]
GKVWVKTDRDWDSVVLFSQLRGYFVLLDLEVFESSQTADEDACDKDACDKDACDDDACDDDACFEGACDEDLTDDDFYVDDFDEDDFVGNFYVEDAFNGDACDAVPGNSMEHITKEAILSLNNGSVTFEQARASFN